MDSLGLYVVTMTRHQSPIIVHKVDIPHIKIRKIQTNKKTRYPTVIFYFSILSTKFIESLYDLTYYTVILYYLRSYL